ncbi:hypothetical protein GLOTRDRAFT_72055 [Gloeophyllum trabeum ATCC 11539]|uniref:Snf7-domain-containing protein n=1 Tax=Gloeophyllum trabeum (strain ATCC 11539 / FP-39264 / Madison 617) TaxID=670483 RepID=S7QF90_GLOTA|nr:uncharacterized protein GLOTRDRAFT_72055 [Gloeophyllum trabeum ATCC 11539]EPQ58042.1 hypothetical protein GLOTRDRAFT_72055 [Gloeophyllum trabeum ATCC 11539]
MSRSATPLKFAQLSSLLTYTSSSTSRLQALYSDFTRQKQSNPTSYQSNIDWWRRTLEAVVSKGWQHEASQDRLILHASPSLAEVFRYEGVGKPLSLSTVITELCDSKAYIPLQYFLTASQSIYDPGSLPLRIASYVLGRPLWWALQQVGIVDGEQGGSESDSQRWRKVKGDYVVVSLVEKVADAVIERQRDSQGISLADMLYSPESFKAKFANVLPDMPLSDPDVKVLLKYLERDKRVLAADKEVIKFVDATSVEGREISAVDHGVLELKSAVDNLQAQVDGLQRKIDERTRNISDALRQKRKEIAVVHLRSRKQLEELLSKRLGSLTTLQSTLITVEAAMGDVEIMRSFETSTTTLQAILSHPSLQREKIHETMDAMAAATADAREVDDAIRLGADMAQADMGIDEDQLEKELEQMARDAQSEQGDAEDRRRVEQSHAEAEEVQQRISAAPSTPTLQPGQVSPEPQLDRRQMAARFAALSKHHGEPRESTAGSTVEQRVREPA